MSFHTIKIRTGELVETNELFPEIWEVDMKRHYCKQTEPWMINGKIKALSLASSNGLDLLADRLLWKYIADLKFDNVKWKKALMDLLYQIYNKYNFRACEIAENNVSVSDEDGYLEITHTITGHVKTFREHVVSMDCLKLFVKKHHPTRRVPHHVRPCDYTRGYWSSILNKTIYVKWLYPSCIENHVDSVWFEGSWEFEVSEFIEFFSNYRFYARVSMNYNGPLPDCTLAQRLDYINEYVSLTSGLGKKLHAYLCAVAYSWHAVSCKNPCTPKKLVARWKNHFRWVTSSRPLICTNSIMIPTVTCSSQVVKLKKSVVEVPKLDLIEPPKHQRDQEICVGVDDEDYKLKLKAAIEEEKEKVKRNTIIKKTTIPAKYTEEEFIRDKVIDCQVLKRRKIVLTTESGRKLQAKSSNWYSQHYVDTYPGLHDNKVLLYNIPVEEGYMDPTNACYVIGHARPEFVMTRIKDKEIIEEEKVIIEEIKPDLDLKMAERVAEMRSKKKWKKVKGNYQNLTLELNNKIDTYNRFEVLNKLKNVDLKSFEAKRDNFSRFHPDKKTYRSKKKTVSFIDSVETGVREMFVKKIKTQYKSPLRQALIERLNVIIEQMTNRRLNKIKITFKHATWEMFEMAYSKGYLTKSVFNAPKSYRKFVVDCIMSMLCFKVIK